MFPPLHFRPYRDYITVGGIDSFVVARWRVPVDTWLDAGFEPWSPVRSLWSVRNVLARCGHHEHEFLWWQAFGRAMPFGASLYELTYVLDERVREPLSPIQLLGRLGDRSLSFAPVPIRPPLDAPPVLDTEHYVIVHVLDEAMRGVPDVQLELVIAGGEVRSARTDTRGVARLDRIRAGRVVVRVPGIDGARWRALEGEPSSPSSAAPRFRWHVARPGEDLARIARQYGLTSWKALWNHPKNAALRTTRKWPNMLRPGDDVCVPDVAVHEITRATDATHRLQLRTRDKARLAWSV